MPDGMPGLRQGGKQTEDVSLPEEQRTYTNFWVDEKLL